MTITASSNPSCMNCPNFRHDTSPGGRAIGSCSESGKVIFISGVSSIDHLERIAAACPSYGEPSKGPEPAWFGYVEPVNTGAMPREELSSCRGCVNLIATNDPSVPEGLTLCGATGSRIDPETSHQGCAFAKAGIPAAKAQPLNAVITDPLRVTSPEAVAIKVMATAKREASKPTFDPLSYNTDLEVGGEDKGVILAWRKMTVGDGSKAQDVFLPIFDPEGFSESERDAIPTAGDEDRPELYHDGSGLEEAFAVNSWKLDRPMTLVGEPGVGKTEGARYLAWKLQLPFTHLQLSEETLPDEFLGHPGYSAELGTHFVEGFLPQAIQRPALVLSDEINLAQEAIRQVYRSFNSSSGTIYLDGHEDGAKRKVRKHPYCMHLMALNPVWDARNLGTREMADADVRRMNFFWLEEPEDKVIMNIILSKLEADGLVVSDEEIMGMMKVRSDIKELARSGALPFSWSIGQDVKVAQLLAFYSPSNAYKRALLDYCHPDAAETVLKAVSSVFGFTA